MGDRIHQVKEGSVLIQNVIERRALQSQTHHAGGARRELEDPQGQPQEKETEIN